MRIENSMLRYKAKKKDIFTIHYLTEVFFLQSKNNFTKHGLHMLYVYLMTAVHVFLKQINCF